MRFPHKAQGLCSRCYRLRRELKKVDQWDLSDSRTLESFPRDTSMSRQDVLERLRDKRRARIAQHLSHLRATEELLSADIDGEDLAYKFDHIARLAGSDVRFSRGRSQIFDCDFTDKQRKQLFSS